MKSMMDLFFPRIARKREALVPWPRIPAALYTLDTGAVRWSLKNMLSEMCTIQGIYCNPGGVQSYPVHKKAMGVSW